MKKLIFLTIICLLATGCYDYVELNDLSIISGIGIDKKDNEYEVTYEILNDKKQGTDSSQQKSIIISETGRNLPEALINTTKKSPKQAYFAHLKLLIITEEVASADMQNIIEYFLRSANIRSEFYIVISANSSSKAIFESVSEETPVMSDKINVMLERNFKTKNSIYKNNFEEIQINFLEKGQDAIIPTISFDEELVTLGGNAIFDGYKLKKILNDEESLDLNILTGKATNAFYTFNCPNDDNQKITLNVYKSGAKFKIDKNNKLNIDVSLMTQLKSYSCQKSLKDINTYKIYNDTYAKEFKTKLENFYETLLENKTDILGIGKKLYIKNRKYNKNAWLDLDYKINVDLKINKDGLIFEVKDDN